MAPNPTDGAGIVTFALPRSGHAHLAMYSLDGRRIRLLADRDYEAGTQHVAWDGTDDHGNRMAAGIYFLKLVYGNETRVSRTVILR
jgi:flagellar hook assembly protein FlgD